MNKYLRFPLYVAMTAMMGMGVAACDDENDPGTGGSGELTPQEQALKDVIADYVDMTVVPTYKGMADAAMELHSLCIDIRQKKADGTLATADVEAAGEAWKLARDYWEKSEAWLFGPAGDYYVDPHIDSWPLDQIGMDALLNNPAQMAQMDDEGVYVGNYLGYALQSFHAIEYLLFELTNTTADGNATANSTSVAHHLNYTTEELNYLVGLAADLRNQCILLEACWAGTENVTAEKQDILTETEMDKGINFGERIKNAGQAGSEYVNYLDVMYDIITAGIQNIANEVGNIKIGNPTGKGLASGGMEYDPNYIESPYSLNSIRDFLGNIVSIRNAYQGSPSVDGTIQVPVHTLSSYIATLDADLDNRVKAAIQDAYDKISLMGEPFAYTCGAAEYSSVNEDAIDACNVMNDIFDEVKALLQANH